MIGLDSEISQFNGNAGATISEIAYAVYGRDLLGQSAVSNGPLTGRTFSSVIVTAAGNTKSLT
ncbi:conserved hypothetical protein [Nitrosomonas nitrosa]|uniref:Uncharacterized protein n=1 Tax=Nitrosomonas nitrosa TaxID=52442 RepID=A0A8H8YZQ8_9PROT|nr:conserved hypothetical protein [Nitrosomonas nitrosa]